MAISGSRWRSVAIIAHLPHVRLTKAPLDELGRPVARAPKVLSVRALETDLALGLDATVDEVGNPEEAREIVEGEASGVELLGRVAGDHEVGERRTCGLELGQFETGGTQLRDDTSGVAQLGAAEAGVAQLLCAAEGGARASGDHQR